MRLIDADELKKAIMLKEDVAYETWDELYDSVLEEIDNAPTVATQSQKIGCEICVNRNIKSQKACTSPFGVCEFFNTTPDHSLEIARKSIELGRSLGRTEERVESKRSHGKWIKIFENPFTNGYICSVCGHKIQVTEQFLPQITECEVCGAEMEGGAK